MKLTIERARLLKAIGHVQSVVERRNTIPILSNVLIEARDGAAQFTATDLDMKMSEAAEAQVDTPGAVTAPAHTLFEITRKLPDGAEVSLDASADGGRLTIAAGRTRFALPCLPASEFPQLTADGLTHSFEVGRAELARLIDKTRFAISLEETRYYLNGIHMHSLERDPADGGPVLRAVATDGARLALAENPLPDGAAGMPAIILPRKTVLEVRKLIEDGEGLIKVSVSAAKIQLDFGAAVLTSKLIDGNYPDYERVIPKDNTKSLTLDNDDFTRAVDRVATISAERSRAIKLTLGTDHLTLTVNNPDAGQAVEELSVSYTEEAMDIGFNAKFLLDIVGQIEGTEAELRLKSDKDPVLVLDTQDAHARYVLMPLRV